MADWSGDSHMQDYLAKQREADTTAILRQRGDPDYILYACRSEERCPTCGNFHRIGTRCRRCMDREQQSFAPQKHCLVCGGRGTVEFVSQITGEYGECPCPECGGIQ